MEYNMVSFGGDDGFEWFGGTVNGKYFISHAMWDDDFDCDYGWSGNVQYGLVVRYPGYADQSTSNAIECDNGPNDTNVEPYTTGTFSNLTIIGPIKDGSSVGNSNYGHAIDLRRRVAASIFIMPDLLVIGSGLSNITTIPQGFQDKRIAGYHVLIPNLPLELY